MIQAERKMEYEDAMQLHTMNTEETPMPVPSRERIEKIKAATDPGDVQIAMQFGAQAQRNMAAFSDYILEQVREKEKTNAAETLSELVEFIREIEEGEKEDITAWMPFFNHKNRSGKKNIQKYRKLEVRLNRIEQRLELVRIQLLKEITLFEGMYEKNLEYYQELEEWITAGEETLREAEETTLVQHRRETKEAGQPMALQQLHTYEEGLRQFEKKLHDLKISRTISLQTAPQIYLIQKKKKLLMDKIQTTLFHTIPLWRNQIAIALGQQ